MGVFGEQSAYSTLSTECELSVQSVMMTAVLDRYNVLVQSTTRQTFWKLKSPPTPQSLLRLYDVHPAPRPHLTPQG